MERITCSRPINVFDVLELLLMHNKKRYCADSNNMSQRQNAAAESTTNRLLPFLQHKMLDFIYLFNFFLRTCDTTGKRSPCHQNRII